jgi:hypothetical protein
VLYEDFQIFWGGMRQNMLKIAWDAFPNNLFLNRFSPASYH